MQVEVVPGGDVVTVRVSGKLNTVTAPDFVDRISAIPDSSSVVLDLTGLEFISSAGIRAIVSLYKRLDGRVDIIHATGLVREVFAVSGVQDLLGD